MTSYISKITSYFNPQQTNDSKQAQVHTTRSAASRAHEAADRQFASPGHFQQKHPLAAAQNFSNKKEFKCAHVLTSSFSENTSKIKAVHLLFQIILTGAYENSSVKSLLQRTCEILHSLNPQSLKTELSQISGDAKENKELFKSIQRFPKKIQESAQDGSFSPEKLIDSQSTMALSALQSLFEIAEGKLHLAMDHLKKILKIYKYENPIINDAYQLIRNNLHHKQYQFNEEETALLYKAIHYVHQKNSPNDQFLKTLDQFLFSHPQVARKEASNDLYALQQELEELNTNKKIAAKLQALPGLKSGVRLPQKALEYFLLLREENPFSRFQNTDKQLAEFEKVNDLIDRFCHSSTNKPLKHELLMALRKAADFLYDPTAFLQTQQQNHLYSKFKTFKDSIFADGAAPLSFLHMKEFMELFSQLAQYKDELFRKFPLQDHEKKELKEIFNDFKDQLSIPHSPDQGLQPLEMVYVLKLRNALEIVDRHLNHEQTLMDKASSALTQVVQPIIDRGDALLKRGETMIHSCENMPQTLLKNALGLPGPERGHQGQINLKSDVLPEASEQSSSPYAIKRHTPSANETSEPIRLIPAIQCLEIGADIFKNFSLFVGSSISNKALEKFSSWFLGLLKNVAANAQSKPEYQQALQAINKIIQELELMTSSKQDKGEITGSIRHVIDLIHKSLKVVNIHQLYLNGLKLPRFGGTEEIEINSIALFSENLKTPLYKPAGAQENSCDYKALIDLEKKDFIRNTANFATLNIVYGSKFLCGLNPDDNFYYSLLEESLPSSNENRSNKLRTLFFKKIDEAREQGKISFFRKIAAKSSYRIISPLVHYFTDKFASRLLDNLHENLEQNCKKFADEAIQNFTRYLIILNQSFRRIAYETENVDNLPDMIESELRRANSNRIKHGGSYENLTPEMLYEKFGNKAVDKFAPSIQWSRQLSALVGRLKFQNPSWSQKILNQVMGVCASTIKLALILPEKALNFSLIWGVKKIVSKNQIVNTIVQKSSSSVIDQNGFTHALNSVISEQLGKILDLLREALSEKQNNSQEILSDRESLTQKEHFTALIKNFFEVLSKSKCANQNELIELIERKPFSQYIDDLALDKTVKTAMELIKIGISSVLEKDQLNKRVLEFMTMFNETYKVGAKISPDKAKAMETEIKDKCDKITNLAIDMALHDYFDTSLGRLKFQSRRFIREIKESCSALFETNRTFIDSIKTVKDTDFHQTMTLLENLKTKSAEFQQTRINAIFEALSNEDLDSESKKRLDMINYDLGLHFTRLDNELIQLVHATRDNLTRKNIVENLQDVQKILVQIQDQTQFMTSGIDHLKCSLADLGRVEQILHGLPNEERLANSLVPSLLENISLIRNALQRMIEARVTLDVFTPDLTPLVSSSLISQLKAEKLIMISTSSKSKHLQSLLNQVDNLVLRIPDAKTRDIFLEHVKKIKKCTNSDLLNDLFEQWENDLKTALKKADHTIQDSFQQIKIHVEKSLNSTADSGELNPHFIHVNLASIDNHLLKFAEINDEIVNWAKELNEIPILNFVVSDMMWYRDLVKVLAKDHVKKKMEGSMNFIRKTYNLKYGLLHHGIMIPFLEK